MFTGVNVIFDNVAQHSQINNKQRRSVKVQNNYKVKCTVMLRMNSVMVISSVVIVQSGLKTIFCFLCLVSDLSLQRLGLDSAHSVRRRMCNF